MRIVPVSRQVVAFVTKVKGHRYLELPLLVNILTKAILGGLLLVVCLRSRYKERKKIGPQD